MRDGVYRKELGTDKPWSPLLYAVRNLQVEVVHFLIFEIGWADTKLAEAFAVFESSLKDKSSRTKISDADASNFRAMLRTLGDTTTKRFKAEQQGYLREQEQK